MEYYNNNNCWFCSIGYSVILIDEHLPIDPIFGLFDCIFFDNSVWSRRQDYKIVEGSLKFIFW